MKLVTAIIKPFKLDDVRNALSDLGIQGMTLNSETADQSVKLETGNQYQAAVTVNDPDGDELSYTWVLMRESEATQVGGDKEDVPETITGRIHNDSGPSVTMHAPEDPGAYRLFVYVHDGHGNAGHANIPFLVEQQ